jgi:hypothetical protein
MSSMPLPPDPRPQDSSILRDLEATLQPREIALFEGFEGYDEVITLGSYAKRLWNISDDAVKSEIWVDTPQPIYQFDLLRA